MRPYRSHKMPACDRCRRQKRRCTGEGPGLPCMLCKVHNVSCQYSDTDGGSKQLSRMRQSTRNAGSPSRHGRTVSQLRDQVGEEDVAANLGQQANQRHTQSEKRVYGAIQYSNGLNSAGSVAHSSIIASPVVTEDIQVLDHFIGAQSNSGARPILEHPVTRRQDEPVIYLSVPRRREGLAIAENPGFKQKTILGHLLKPFANDLISLYFDRIHPAFPFLDEEAVRASYQKNDGNLSCAMVCELYALSLTQWNHSDTLARSPQPDTEFVWNLAVESLQEDFLAPGMSTIYAAILDMLGRPILSVVGNTINNGRTVVLANSLGLNRNPMSWRRPMLEKNLRIRLWWAVLIHDRWSSFAHGISPCITSGHYDVPLPVVGNLVTETYGTDYRIRGAECFIQLCKLSELLGDILPLVYDLKIRSDPLWKDIRRLEADLDTWENSIPVYLQYAENAGSSPASGLSNLRLCYLAVRLLISRISLHAASMEDELDRQESVRYHLSKLRRSAQDVVVFVCSLQRSNLQEFWLPYTAHFLTLTVIILLRCTIESVDPAAIESSRSSLIQLWQKLRQAATQDQWDLANICIDRCQEPFYRVAGSFSDGLSHDTPETSPGPAGYNTNLSTYPERPGRMDTVPDLLPFANPDMSFESSEFLWDALWYGLDGTGNQSLDGTASDVRQT